MVTITDCALTLMMSERVELDILTENANADEMSDCVSVVLLYKMERCGGSALSYVCKYTLQT